MKVKLVQGFVRVYETDNFFGDFAAMFGKNRGEARRYVLWLLSMLLILDEKGMSALQYEQFEHLENTKDPNIFAIRHPHSQINERYLYVYEDGEISVLLTAFKEKSPNDYPRNIIRAQNIYAELEMESIND
jgi:hypothetical protein